MRKKNHKQLAFSLKIGLSFFIVFVIIFIHGCSSPQITPLSDPLFRLNTILKPTGCGDKKQVPCRWEITGTINSFKVVSGGENPFRDCQDCHFNQKIGLMDTEGAVHFIYYRLPTEEAITLTQGLAVELTFIDASNIGRGYAISLRKVGEGVIFAASNGAGGHYLTKDLLSPMVVDEDLDNVAGKEANECGTKVFRYLTFSVGGNNVKLEPGKMEILKDTTGRPYKVANVNHFNRDGVSSCANVEEPPFSFFILFSPAGS